MPPSPPARRPSPRPRWTRRSPPRAVGPTCRRPPPASSGRSTQPSRSLARPQICARRPRFTRRRCTRRCCTRSGDPQVGGPVHTRSGRRRRSRRSTRLHDHPHADLHRRRPGDEGIDRRRDPVVRGRVVHTGGAIQHVGRCIGVPRRGRAARCRRACPVMLGGAASCHTPVRAAAGSVVVERLVPLPASADDRGPVQSVHPGSCSSTMPPGCRSVPMPGAAALDGAPAGDRWAVVVSSSEQYWPAGPH